MAGKAERTVFERKNPTLPKATKPALSMQSSVASHTSNRFTHFVDYVEHAAAHLNGMAADGGPGGKATFHPHNRGGYQDMQTHNRKLTELQGNDQPPGNNLAGSYAQELVPGSQPKVASCHLVGGHFKVYDANGKWINPPAKPVHGANGQLVKKAEHELNYFSGVTTRGNYNDNSAGFERTVDNWNNEWAEKLLDDARANGGTLRADAKAEALEDLVERLDYDKGTGKNANVSIRQDRFDESIEAVKAIREHLHAPNKEAKDAFRAAQSPLLDKEQNATNLVEGVQAMSIHGGPQQATYSAYGPAKNPTTHSHASPYGQHTNKTSPTATTLQDIPIETVVVVETALEDPIIETDAVETALEDPIIETDAVETGLAVDLISIETDAVETALEDPIIETDAVVTTELQTAAAGVPAEALDVCATTVAA